VQLAPWISGDLVSESETRLAQTTALQLPFVGMAVTIDLGDAPSPYGDIHPQNKQSVGQRLALGARALSYGERVQYEGPTLSSARLLQPSPNVVIEIDFIAATKGTGLTLAAVTCPNGVPANNCNPPYQVQTSDGQWVAADYRIVGVNPPDQRITLTATVSASLRVTGVRYAYANFPLCAVYNVQGLPAPPFVANLS